MRASIALPALLALAACAPQAAPHAPGLAGYLHILETARDARQACAIAQPDCPSGLDESLARAEAGTPAGLLLPRREAEAERRMAESAFQAAFADCRARGIRPGTPRWESCHVDRSIARLSDLAALP